MPLDFDSIGELTGPASRKGARQAKFNLMPEYHDMLTRAAEQSGLTMSRTLELMIAHACEAPTPAGVFVYCGGARSGETGQPRAVAEQHGDDDFDPLA